MIDYLLYFLFGFLVVLGFLLLILNITDNIRESGMKLRLKSAWNCLKGNPTIFNVHFTDSVKLAADNKNLYIGLIVVDNGGVVFQSRETETHEHIPDEDGHCITCGVYVTTPEWIAEHNDH